MLKPIYCKTEGDNLIYTDFNQAKNRWEYPGNKSYYEKVKEKLEQDRQSKNQKVKKSYRLTK